MQFELDKTKEDISQLNFEIEMLQKKIKKQEEDYIMKREKEEKDKIVKEEVPMMNLDDIEEELKENILQPIKRM